MHLHDTHFHLDLFENPQQIIQSIEQAKIYTIAVTNLPEIFDYTNNLTKDSKYIRTALGFHPELASQHKHQINLFQTKINATRYIGEVGLDNFNKLTTDYQNQKLIFEKIIEACSNARSKILTIHSRRSEKDVVSIIGDKFSGKIILHWYSGTIKELERALSYGFYFSINHAMCHSDNGKKIIDAVPSNRLLIETDGPFIKTKDIVSTPLVSSTIAREVCKLKNQNNLDAFGVELKKTFKSLLQTEM